MNFSVTCADPIAVEAGDRQKVSIRKIDRLCGIINDNTRPLFALDDVFSVAAAPRFVGAWMALERPPSFRSHDGAGERHLVLVVPVAHLPQEFGPKRDAVERTGNAMEQLIRIRRAISN